jgi:hypothetical protein
MGTFPLTQPISAMELQKRIAQALGQKFTGVAMISYLTSEKMLLFIRQGDVRQVYFNHGDDGFHRLTESWVDRVIAGQSVRLSMQPMLERRLFFEKARLEIREGGKTPKKAYPTTELNDLFASSENRESATLFHICWQNAEAFVLVPGSKITLRLAVFNSEGIAEENSHALDKISSWPEVKCEVTEYNGGLESEAWIELHLNMFFEWLCNYMLAQYGFLTGQMMVTSVVQNLIIYALQSGWDIVRSGDKLVDQTIFGSSVEAARAYNELLALVNEHLMTMLGSSLLQSIKRQGLLSFNPFYLALGRSYELIS